MDYFTQPPASSRDEVPPPPTAPESTSSIGPANSSRPGSAHGAFGGPQSSLRPSSIRIRRLPSASLVPQINVQGPDDGIADGGKGEQAGRRRSSSAPQPMHLSTAPRIDLTRQRSADLHMPSVREEPSEPYKGSPHLSNPAARAFGAMRRLSTTARSAFVPQRLDGSTRPNASREVGEYESGVVDLLDVVGPLNPMFDQLLR